jgi:glycosyltransferase involved in cell wall biosynthesis
LNLYIDASSIFHTGGGFTHLDEIIKNYDFKKYKFHKIHVFGSKLLLDKIINNEIIIKRNSKLLNKNSIFLRFLWLIYFQYLLFIEKPSILFNVAMNIHLYRNSVSICHNLQPFDPKSFSNYTLREKIYFFIKRNYQLLCFVISKKVIFLNKTSLNYVKKYYKNIEEKSIIIPHGISSEFLNNNSIKNKTILGKSINIIYPSSLLKYKNHINLIYAFELIYLDNKNVKLFLIGEFDELYLNELNSIIFNKKLNNNIIFIPTLNKSDLIELYNEIDIFIYPSLVESFGITVLEAMAIGLPISCSNIDTFLNFFSDSVLYFDPFSIESIRNSIHLLIYDLNTRKKYINRSVEFSRKYTWENTSSKTFNLLLNL